MACPFLVALPQSGRHVCVARENDRIVMSPGYLRTCCATHKHGDCSLFLRATAQPSVGASGSTLHRGGTDADAVRFGGLADVGESKDIPQGTRALDGGNDRQGAAGHGEVSNGRAECSTTRTQVLLPAITQPAGNTVLTTDSITIAGTSNRNCLVHVFDWLRPVATSKSDDRGMWAVTVLGLTEGYHMYSVEVVDPTRGVVDRSATRLVSVRHDVARGQAAPSRGFFARGRGLLRHRSRRDLKEVPVSTMQGPQPVAVPSNGHARVPDPKPKEQPVAVIERVPRGRVSEEAVVEDAPRRSLADAWIVAQEEWETIVLEAEPILDPAPCTSSLAVEQCTRKGEAVREMLAVPLREMGKDKGAQQVC